MKPLHIAAIVGGSVVALVGGAWAVKQIGGGPLKAKPVVVARPGQAGIPQQILAVAGGSASGVDAVNYANAGAQALGALKNVFGGQPTPGAAVAPQDDGGGGELAAEDDYQADGTEPASWNPDGGGDNWGPDADFYT